MAADYTEDDIKSLDWKEHIRLRPGMYIGKLGDGTSADDGVYVLLKEVIDNCIDEFVMGHGKSIEIDLNEKEMRVRDFGRGIPLGKLMDCAAKINTGAKYDSKAFKKSVGLNGVGIKAVNALSSNFKVQAYRENKTRAIEFSAGEVTKEMKTPKASKDPSGTELVWLADETVFGTYTYDHAIIEQMLRNYSYLNKGLTLVFNGKKFKSDRGLFDLLTEQMGTDQKPLYPIIHLVDNDIEVAFTHAHQNGEDYFSFVNGQNTTQGGTHLAAFRESVVKTVRDHAKKQFDAADVRQGIIAAVSVRVIEPVFESQTKTKLGSTHMEPDGQTIRTFVSNFLADKLDNHLHKHKKTADAMITKIQLSEKERKEMKGIQKAAREGAKAAKVHNKKLRDCKIHFSNKRNPQHEETTLFITEGDSASGSITTSRNADTQAVFSLKGKPLNTYGKSRKVVYENEEFNLLQHALDIENGMDNLRFNNVVLATDADVDGMHIRLLLITFFVQFFPDLIREGHLYILQTPLFRVRNKKETRYCYDEDERLAALRDIKNPEITRFKGLGEISPHEFKYFIGEDMRLDPVELPPATKTISELLSFYMGKNTEERQKFIIKNLRVEADLIEDGPEEELEAA